MLISIIIPCFNEVKTIELIINGALNVLLEEYKNNYSNEIELLKKKALQSL